MPVTMSPPPPNEDPMIIPTRPKSLTWVGVVGIILGSLATLCLVGSIAMTQVGPGAIAAERMSPTDIILSISNALIGLCLSTMLIVGAIALLGLRPWSRTLMIVVEAADLIFQIFKFIVGLVHDVPQKLDMLLHNPPPEWPTAKVQQIQSMMGFIRIWSYGVLAMAFLIPAGYAVITLIVLNRANVKRPSTRRRCQTCRG